MKLYAQSCYSYAQELLLPLLHNEIIARHTQLASKSRRRRTPAVPCQDQQCPTRHGHTLAVVFPIVDTSAVDSPRVAAAEDDAAEQAAVRSLRLPEPSHHEGVVHREAAAHREGVEIRK